MGLRDFDVHRARRSNCYGLRRPAKHLRRENGAEPGSPCPRLAFTPFIFVDQASATFQPEEPWPSQHLAKQPNQSSAAA